MTPDFRTAGLRGLVLVLIVLALAACDKQQPASDDASSGNTDVATTSDDAAASGDTTAQIAASDTAEEQGFDIDSVPVSDATLGEFPYFSLPKGYENPNHPNPVVDMDRVPFWTGDRMEWVEGRAFQSLIHAEKGKSFSPFEVKKNIEQLISSVGGVQVTDSRIPQDVLDGLEDSYTVRYSDGHGDIWNNPAQTYLVRREDRNIWVHVSTDSASGGWIIAESAPFVPTATLLPADKLKQQLDANGKVAVEVNFATDKAEILADSQPQIDQVLALLRDNPELKLSINGHTDDTGNAAYNLQLSDARAKSVVLALTGRGIEAARLQAKGFGQSQPVADNVSEEGKAANRRVELVKR